MHELVYYNPYENDPSAILLHRLHLYNMNVFSPQLLHFIASDSLPQNDQISWHRYHDQIPWHRNHSVLRIL